MQEHGATEPVACARCGHVSPRLPGKPPETQAPWRRYLLQRQATGWRFVCRDQASCAQRQRHKLLRTDTDQWDPLSVVVDAPPGFTATLDAPAEQCGSINEAIARFQLAQARAPRSWHDIGARDVHALLGLVAAVHALEHTVNDVMASLPLPARKSGATWDDIAAMEGYGNTGDHYRDRTIASWRSMDRPAPEVNAEINALLDAAPHSGPPPSGRAL